jgi:hypothetical protein
MFVVACNRATERPPRRLNCPVSPGELHIPPLLAIHPAK